MPLIPDLPGVPGQTPTPVPIRPAVEAASQGLTVSASTMVLTVLILVGIIMFLVIGLVLLKIFASPMDAAKSSRLSGQALIMHFETAKSAVFKLARIEGQGLRHKKVEDGTLAAIPESVNSLGGRPTGLAFSLFGTLLPIKVVAGASVLKEKGIKDLQEVYKKYITIKYKEIQDAKGKKMIQPYNYLDNQTLIKGYDFNNFNTLLTQVNVSCLIPLSVEAVMDFTTKNINAHYTEKRINLKFMAWLLDHPDSGFRLLLITGMLSIVLIIIGAKVI